MNGILALKVINGLGNRLRAYSFYKSIAQDLNREFLLCWESGIGFDNTKFNDLFKNEEKLISINEFNNISKTSINLNNYIYYSKCKLFEEAKGNQFDPEKFNEEVLQNIIKDSFHIHNFKEHHLNTPLTIETGNIAYVGEEGFNKEYEKYNTDYIKILRNLEIQPTIREKVTKIISNFKNTYGIHIRKGDATDRNNPDSRQYLEGHDDNYFIFRMEEVLSHDPEATFFLCTDSEETFNKLKEKYKDKIIINPFKKYYNSGYNQRKQGQMDAIVDMYALSNTKKIYGTTWSTFSHISSLINNKELVLSGRMY